MHRPGTAARRLALARLFVHKVKSQPVRPTPTRISWLAFCSASISLLGEEDRRQAGNCPGTSRRGVQPCASRSQNMLLTVLRGALWSFFVLLATVAFGATPDAITVDGGRYFGPLVDGKLHGRGRVEWENGTVYEGEFAKGLMSGKGRMRYATGSSYEGEWREGMSQFA